MVWPTGRTVVSIGRASGEPPAVDQQLVTVNGLRLAGGSVSRYAADPSEIRRRAAVVVEALQEGWLGIDDSTRYDLQRAADAHRDIEGRSSRGKLFLYPDLQVKGTDS